MTLTQAKGTAERETALELLERRPGLHRVTCGGDENYDTAELVEQCCLMNVTPHVACRARSALDHRATRHEGYRRS